MRPAAADSHTRLRNTVRDACRGVLELFATQGGCIELPNLSSWVHPAHPAVQGIRRHLAERSCIVSDWRARLEGLCGTFRVLDAAPVRGASTPRRTAASGAPWKLAARHGFPRRRCALQPALANGGCRRRAGAVARSTPLSEGENQGRDLPRTGTLIFKRQSHVQWSLKKTFPYRSEEEKASAGCAMLYLWP